MALYERLLFPIEAILKAVSGMGLIAIQCLKEMHSH